MTHAGQPVQWGERGVLVASFSPCADDNDTNMGGVSPSCIKGGEPDDLAPLFADVQ